ncbi:MULTISPECIES: tetratricopeptide repeat protein [unclassified Variovorax]|uniref:tetratricopeptide repeat protein n=1 Tax=unclassified Variovorax TaxID=663243 RepID=UPI0008D154A9|nr:MULTISPECIES: tetratricopeptide repeat protein [unclassified Variovorax]SEJ00852.1 Tetratricopeptide repeat-containing protein [Variovorax sp. OK202]SFB90916.1 Tetratricopeptide repeat-containing protein [Variovorax sp. OK212]
MTASPRRPGFAYLLLAVGGFAGAHRFYLGSYLGGAAQLALMAYGLSGLPGARFALLPLLPWLLFDIYWVHRKTRPGMVVAVRGVKRPGRPENKDYDLAALAEANKLQASFVAAAEAQDWAQAVVIADQIVASARRIFKGPHLNLAMSLCMLGQACYQCKAFDKAKANLEECLAIGRKIGMPAEDMDIARKALALTLAGIGERKARGAETDGEAALLHLLEEKETRYRDALAQGDLPRAERLCAEAVATSRQLCGGPGKSVVFHLSSHAELCRRLQWPDKAEVAANEALAMAGQLGLDDSWRRGPTNTLALLHAAAGRADEAEALYKKTIAMAIAEAKGGSSDGVVRAFNNLAFLYAESGQNDKAELCYARALVHLDKLREADGEDQGDAELHSHMLNNFAGLLMARRDFDGARPLYERSLAIQQHSCRGISTAAANAHNDLGLMAQDDGDLRQALMHFQRTLLLNQICTPDHFNNLESAQRNIDSVSMVLALVARAARMEPST